jgi:hypothetical protein
MQGERKQRLNRAVERVIASVASGERSLGTGGLFELAYPVAAADVPDATPEEITAAFASIWGIVADERAFYQRILAVCDRHHPQAEESITEILHRAASSGDLEAAYFLGLAVRE